MSSIYAQRHSTAQKKDAPTAASVLDASSQSEGLQRKADMANNAAQREEAPHPNNTGMPDNLKSGIESLSGFSMDDVRVHYNSSKPATVQALAYTQGTDIHVAPGQEKHLPHEAWHVAQQMAGRVSPTTNINGMPVNDNAGLEHEADVMGEKAVQCKEIIFNTIHSTRKNNVAQGKFWEKINNEYIWHNEEPENWRYEKTDEYSSVYPVYKERVLDVTPIPKKDLPPETCKISTIYKLLDDGQRNKLQNNINTLSQYCDDDGITKVIEGALKNVKNGSIILTKNDNARTRGVTLFTSRFTEMTQYIQSVGDTDYENNNKIKDIFTIEPTGSDPHTNGQHALFLRKRDNPSEKIVYKPHSLQFENAFMGGDNSFLGRLNSLISDPSIKFATMGISPIKNTESFIKRYGGPESNNTETEICFEKYKTFMFQLGMLDIAAEIFGVTDLHAENVIFGEKGPLAIDAECGCAFGHSTGMDSNLSPAMCDDTTLLNPSSLYVQGMQQTSGKEFYYKGKDFMKKILVLNIDFLNNIIDNTTANIDKVRLVPINTSMTACILDQYTFYGDTYLSDGEIKTKDIINKLETFINTNNLLKEASTKINNENLIKYFDLEIKKGLLPAFELDLDNKKILLNGNEIGSVDNAINLKKKMAMHMKKKVKAIPSITDHILAKTEIGAIAGAGIGAIAGTGIGAIAGAGIGAITGAGIGAIAGAGAGVISWLKNKFFG